MKKTNKLFAFLLSICMLMSAMCMLINAEESGETVFFDCDCQEHTHEEACYNEDRELICGKKEFHVHTAACFDKVDGKAWPQNNICHTLTCTKEAHSHSYTCLTEEGKAAILNAYAIPNTQYKVPEYSEPYIFSTTTTYLNPGYYYHNPNDGHASNPKMMLMANVQGLTPGVDKWQWEGGENNRFVLGQSNFVVAYCCDQDTDAKQYIMYRQINLEDAGYYDDETAQIIRSVMMNGYPALSVEEIHQNLKAAGFEDYALLDEGDVLTGTQLAVWHLANSNTISQMHYRNTKPSKVQPLTANWQLGDGIKYLPEAAARVDRFVDYLLDLAKNNPIAAPKSQIVVSQVEVANLIMTPDENGKHTVDLQVILNTGFEAHEETNITICVTAGDVSTEVQADGSASYSVRLEGYTQGDEITVTMSGTQYLEAGVYFYEPYAPEGNIREVSQNMVGLNTGAVPVGDTVVLDGETFEYIPLEIKKVDDEGNGLSGAEFDLSYVDEEGVTTFLDTYAVDENGYLTIDGLMIGKRYQIVESKAPEGYDAIIDPVSFIVQKNEEGIISLEFDLPDGVSYVTEEDGSSVLEVVNTKPIEIPDDPPPLDPPKTGENTIGFIILAVAAMMMSMVLATKKRMA